MPLTMYQSSAEPTRTPELRVSLEAASLPVEEKAALKMASTG
jgi:hypothetical protein